MLVIDADGHIEESPSMFERLEPEFRHRRPQPVVLERDSIYGERNALWIIDGQAFHFGSNPTAMERAQRKPASIGAQEMTDIEARLRDLDAEGIDQHVVYPTLFLSATTPDAALEAALHRCYNSFVGEACARSGGRVHFAALAPFRVPDEAAREVRRARALGAVSVMVQGVVWDRALDDPRLFPLYEEIAALGLPLVVHFGPGSPVLRDAISSPGGFHSSVLPVLMGFHAILSSGLMETFPRLRVAFLEAGSAWVPWLGQQVGRLGASSKTAAAYFREGRMFVACEADEDIGHLVSYTGEDAVVAASDYPHSDFSHEDHLVEAIMSREDLPIRVREKLLGANAQALYGI